MKAFLDIGFEFFIIGGIIFVDLSLFKDIRVKAFIVGRVLVGAVNSA